MTDENKNSGAGNNKPEKPKTPYKVGYGKPPPEHQFKKGKSGNPRGRPPIDKDPKVYTADDLRRKILKLSNRKVNTVVDGKQTPMAMIMAIYMRLFQRAMEGHLPSIREILKIIPVLFEKEDEAVFTFTKMIMEAEEVRNEQDRKKTRYNRELDRYEDFERRRGFRNIMGVEALPYEADEPRNERDWKAYDQYLDDLKNKRKATWPPTYWDEEDPDQKTPPADPKPPPEQK